MAPVFTEVTGAALKQALPESTRQDGGAGAAPTNTTPVDRVIADEMRMCLASERPNATTADMAAAERAIAEARAHGLPTFGPPTAADVAAAQGNRTHPAFAYVANAALPTPADDTTLASDAWSTALMTSMRAAVRVARGRVDAAQQALQQALAAAATADGRLATARALYERATQGNTTSWAPMSTDDVDTSLPMWTNTTALYEEVEAAERAATAAAAAVRAANATLQAATATAQSPADALRAAATETAAATSAASSAAAAAAAASLALPPWTNTTPLQPELDATAAAIAAGPGSVVDAVDAAGAVLVRGAEAYLHGVNTTVNVVLAGPGIIADATAGMLHECAQYSLAISQSFARYAGMIGAATVAYGVAQPMLARHISGDLRSVLNVPREQADRIGAFAAWVLAFAAHTTAQAFLMDRTWVAARWDIAQAHLFNTRLGLVVIDAAGFSGLGALGLVVNWGLAYIPNAIMLALWNWLHGIAADASYAEIGTIVGGSLTFVEAVMTFVFGDVGTAVTGVVIGGVGVLTLFSWLKRLYEYLGSREDARMAAIFIATSTLAMQAIAVAGRRPDGFRLLTARQDELLRGLSMRVKATSLGLDRLTEGFALADAALALAERQSDEHVHLSRGVLSLGMPAERPAGGHLRPAADAHIATLTAAIYAEQEWLLRGSVPLWRRLERGATSFKHVVMRMFRETGQIVDEADVDDAYRDVYADIVHAERMPPDEVDARMASIQSMFVTMAQRVK